MQVFHDLDVENDDVVSTWPNVVHINVETHNVDSTLSNVVNSNIETTLECLLGNLHIKELDKT